MKIKTGHEICLYHVLPFKHWDWLTWVIDVFGRFISFFYWLTNFMFLLYFWNLFDYLDLLLFIRFMVFGDDSWRLINKDFKIIICYFILENMSITESIAVCVPAYRMELRFFYIVHSSHGMALLEVSGNRTVSH